MALNRPLRLGIVGLGRMGLRHRQTWQQFTGVELVAVCDPDPLVRQWATEQQLQSHATVEQLFPDIDIAVIASPSNTHFSSAYALLGQGIACLVEKPLAFGVEECRQLARQATHNGALLAVGHCERFNPGVIQASAVLKGSSASLEVYRHSSHAASADSDVIDDLLVHDLDWILHAGQAPSATQVLASTRVAGRLQAIECRLDFASGQQVNLSAGYERIRRREVLLACAKPVESISLDWQPVPGQADPLTLQAQAFLLALQGGPGPITTAEEALNVALLCEQLRQQALGRVESRACCDA